MLGCLDGLGALKINDCGQRSIWNEIGANTKNLYNGKCSKKEIRPPIQPAKGSGMKLKSTRAQIEKPYKSNWVGVSGKFIGRQRVCVCELECFIIYKRPSGALIMWHKISKCHSFVYKVNSVGKCIKSDQRCWP